ncbi:MAG TPA: enolase C-terminal domain-like protein [Burkholderiales bacterium]
MERASVAAYTVPTEALQSDGTLEWRSTTLVCVHLDAAGTHGFGYTYADKATAALIKDRLLPLVEGREPLDPPARFAEMVRAIRNLGRPGIASMAISAVDAALWDLKGKLLGAPLAALLGTARDAIAVYGSGGFTSYSIREVRAQLGEWAAGGLPFVKMKVGRDAAVDGDRVKQARDAIGTKTALFVDANGAYERKQALEQAQRFSESGVVWFEEPVSSDDLQGLRLLRDRGPAGMDISAGEYGYDLPYFRRMLEAQAVDVLQADATRCGGITGFMAVAALADAFGVPLSSHCAPSLHIAPCCAARRAVHLEHFHDHVRIERMLFDGFREPQDGALGPDRSRPGLGIELKAADAERYRASLA